MTKQKKNKSIRFKPCGHYILVKPDKVEKMTASGIIISNDMQAKREHVASVRGTLVAVGEQAWKAFGGKAWADVGAKIYFKRHVSDRIVDDNDLDESGNPQEYFLMADENALAVIED